MQKRANKRIYDINIILSIIRDIIEKKGEDMSNNQNIISETELLQNWNNLPYVSIKSEMIMTIKQLDSAIRNRKSKVLDFYKGELAFADKNQFEEYQSSLQDLMCGLSNLAKMNNIVLLVITEVSVLSEKGIEGPSLKAFSRAMAIPNEADMVLLLYRKEDNTDEDSIDVIEDLGLTIAKNKRGGLEEISMKRNNYTGEYFFCEK